MPHTLNATVMDDNSPGAQLLSKHLELGADFGSIGHGLDVLLALGTRDKSLIEGFTAAVFPNQEHLLRISKVNDGKGTAHSMSVDTEARCTACQYKYKEDAAAGGKLVSLSYWGEANAENLFLALALGFDDSGPKGGEGPPERLHIITTTEPVLRLEISRLPGITGATFAGDPGAPRVALFVDDVADPMEAYLMLAHLMSEKYNVQIVSHSTREKEEKLEIRQVTTETVFGNAMYPLKDCVCIFPSTPAESVPEPNKFDGFFIAGGQCPYFMMNDAAVTTIMNACSIAAAVCHGPEAMIGSKWLHGPDGAVGSFMSYYGAWISFRDVIDKYEKKKPGEICQDVAGCLFTGNAPASTKPMTVAACAAINAAKKDVSG